jgi:hypothetical protein
MKSDLALAYADSATREPISLPADPHQLDFDWRFTPSTCLRLAHQLNGSDSIAILGAPSLVPVLLKGSAHVTLFDWNAARVVAVEDHARCVDLRYYMPNSLEIGVYDACFLDPPWYPDYLERWLDIAGLLIKPGGRILLSLWPRSIRPTAAHELRAIFELLRNIGTVTVSKGALRYQTPLFEIRSAGCALPPDYRRGDLVEVVKKCWNRHTKRPSPPQASRWVRYLFGSRQIAIKIADDPAPRPFFIKRVPGLENWILNNTSRRNRHVQQVQFWTSDNLVCQISTASPLTSALDAIVQGARPALTGNLEAFLKWSCPEVFTPVQRRMRWVHLA